MDLKLGLPVGSYRGTRTRELLMVGESDEADGDKKLLAARPAGVTRSAQVLWRTIAQQKATLSTVKRLGLT